jgi:hypothetical protein
MRTPLEIPLYIFVAMLLAGCQAQFPRNNEFSDVDNRQLQELRNLPPLLGPEYTCETAVTVANHLRKLGKPRVLRLLADYEKMQDLRAERGENIAILCELLFEMPRDVKVPVGGSLTPLPDKSAIPLFSDYPLASVDRVPFMLVYIRSIGG